jgi:hypothetical protein
MQAYQGEVKVTLWLTVSMSWCQTPLWDMWPDITSCWNVVVLFLCGALSDEDGSTSCSAITQWSESLRTCNHTLLSHLKLPQCRGPGSHIYIPQEQGGPVIPPGTGFPLLSILQLAELRWRYSNPPQPGGPGTLRNRMVQSKSCHDRQSVNQYIPVPSPCGFRSAPNKRTSIGHQEGVH